MDRTNDPAPPNIPAAVWQPYEMELDTVVHELGHAVADVSQIEPVTRIEEGIVGRYTEQYLVLIRTTDKPAGP